MKTIATRAQDDGDGDFIWVITFDGRYNDG